MESIFKVTANSLIENLELPHCSHPCYFEHEINNGSIRYGVSSIEHFQEIASLFDKDGNFSLDEYPYFESYAIRLWYERKEEKAFELFNLISLQPDGSNIPIYLEGHDVANKKHHLGYDGLYVYGILCLSFKKKDLAKVLFEKIIDTVLQDTKSTTIYLADTARDALRHLKLINPSGEYLGKAYYKIGKFFFTELAG